MIKYIQLDADKNIVATYDEFPSYLVGADLYDAVDITPLDEEIHTKGENISIKSIEGRTVYITYNLQYKDDHTLKAVFKNRINRERVDKVYDKGILDWNGNLWDINQPTIVNLTAYMVAIGSGFYNKDHVTWRTYDNKNVSLSLSEFGEFAVRVLEYVSGEFSNSWEKKDNFDGSLSTEEILRFATRYKILN